jgi:hypothetical protein
MLFLFEVVRIEWTSLEECEWIQIRFGELGGNFSGRHEMQ